MDIEFDPAKDAINLRQHHVSLAFGAEIFGDADHVVIPTVRIEDEEERFKLIGLVGDRLWTGVHVMRGQAVRFISVRKSNDGERKIYYSP